jgi:hypothetical protein
MDKFIKFNDIDDNTIIVSLSRIMIWTEIDEDANLSYFAEPSTGLATFEITKDEFDRIIALLTDVLI